jgi:hypothetical protein
LGTFFLFFFGGTSFINDVNICVQLHFFFRLLKHIRYIFSRIFWILIKLESLQHWIASHAPCTLWMQATFKSWRTFQYL